MHIRHQRLLSGLRQAIDELAVLSGDPLRATIHQGAAHTMLAELARVDCVHDLRDQYECGRDLALRLAAATGSAGQALVSELPAYRCDSPDLTAARALLARLRAAVASVIAMSGYPAGIGSEVDASVLALMQWESTLFKLPTLPEPPERSPLDFEALLERSARTQGGVLANARLLRCIPLLGGFGNTTVLFEVEDIESRRWQLVCRAMREDVPLGVQGRDIGGEFHLLRYLHRRGAAVAEPLWLENQRLVEGVRFLVSRQVKGRNLGTVVSSEPLNQAQARALASELAKIHRMPIDATDADLQSSIIDPAHARVPVATAVQRYLDRWVDLWRSFDVGPSPIVEATLHWLRANAPQGDDDVPVLVHGDYALHNILLDGDQIGGVLDWEMAHIGDRAEDIAWLLMSIGRYVQAEDFVREYVAAGGRSVTLFQLKYYEVLGYFKMLVVMQESQLRFDTLPHAGPEYCVLGLEFIQIPTSKLEAAIRAAEAAR